jgi:hypothetical protein
MSFDDIRNMSPTDVRLLRGVTEEEPYGKASLGRAANPSSSDKGIEPLDMPSDAMSPAAMPPAAMPPAARQSAPMDHDIHIDLLNRLFKHIHSASSLPTLAHQFGEFVIEQIEEELKHDIQKKKEFTKYVKDIYRPIVRKKKSILTESQQDELAKALIEFSDTIPLIPHYQEIKTVIDNGYSALEEENNSNSSKGRPDTKNKTRGKKKRRGKKKTRRNRGGSRSSITTHHTAPGIPPVSVIVIVIITLYLFASWIGIYYYLSRVASTYDFSQEDSSIEFTAFLEGFSSGNYLESFINAVRGVATLYSNQLLYNIFHSLSMLIFMVNNSLGFHEINFLRNTRNAEYINHIRILFCDVTLVALFLIVTVYYCIKKIVNIIMTHTLQGDSSWAEYMRFINHIIGIRGLINTGWSILLGHHRTRYMQTHDGAYDTLVYMLSMGGRNTGTLFDDPRIATLSISEALWFLVQNRVRAVLPGPRVAPPSLTQGSSSPSPPSPALRPPLSIEQFTELLENN